MRKTIRTNSLRGLAAPAIGALSLAVVLATSGCSTNRMPGNGTPANPSNIGSSGTATTLGTSSGNDSAKPPENPPMISSSAGDAASTMAAIQPHVERVLGPADPAAGADPTSARAAARAMIGRRIKGPPQRVAFSRKPNLQSGPHHRFWSFAPMIVILPPSRAGGD